MAGEERDFSNIVSKDIIRYTEISSTFITNDQGMGGVILPLKPF
jgi:hypothetical protein